jgi:hypothetical protein
MLSLQAVPETQPITLMLRRFADGDKESLDRLMPLVYAELRRLAGGFLSRESIAHTLQPTAAGRIFFQLPPRSCGRF